MRNCTCWSCAWTRSVSEIEVARSIRRSSTVSCERHVISRAFRSTNWEVTSFPDTVDDVTVPKLFSAASACSNDASGILRMIEPDRSPDEADSTKPPKRPAVAVAAASADCRPSRFTRSARLASLMIRAPTPGMVEGPRGWVESGCTASALASGRAVREMARPRRPPPRPNRSTRSRWM